MQRELNKAFVGFHSPESKTELESVATGSCGAFHGYPWLKLILQLMAASQAGRNVAYFTFGDEELMRDGVEMYKLLHEHNVTVGKLDKL